MKKIAFLLILSLSLATVISSCSEDEISEIDCNGLLATKPLAEIKHCINGKWKVIRSYNIYTEFSINWQLIEFKSNSIGIIYYDGSIMHYYPIEWVKYDKVKYDEDTVYYVDAYYMETNFRDDIYSKIGLVEIVNDTLTISEIRSEGPDHTLVRVDNFPQ